MTASLLDGIDPQNPEQRAVVEGLAAMLERLDLPQLDLSASTAVVDANGLHVTLLHRVRPELRVDVNTEGYGEIVVTYGVEHEHFRSEDAEMGRVWPFPSDDHIRATLTLVECLLTGRVELQIWKRPLGVRTRSYWINQEGQPELFLRGGTAGLVFGWSRTPEIQRFDYSKSSPLPRIDI